MDSQSTRNETPQPLAAPVAPHADRAAVRASALRPAPPGPPPRAPSPQFHSKGRYVPIDESADYSGRSGGDETRLRAATPRAAKGGVATPDIGPAAALPGRESASAGMGRGKTRAAAFLGALGPAPARGPGEGDVAAPAEEDAGQAPRAHVAVDRRHFFGQESYGKGLETDLGAGEPPVGSAPADKGQGPAKSRSGSSGEGKVPVGEHGAPAEHRGGYFGVD